MELELGPFLNQPTPIAVEDIAMVVVLREGVAGPLRRGIGELGVLCNRRDLHVVHDGVTRRRSRRRRVLNPAAAVTLTNATTPATLRKPAGFTYTPPIRLLGVAEGQQRLRRGGIAGQLHEPLEPVVERR